MIAHRERCLVQGVQLLLQPFWIRALLYGLPFGLLLGLHAGVQQPSRPVGVIVSTLVAGIGFGLAMAYQSQSVHAAVTEAVAGLDDASGQRLLRCDRGCRPR